ncbi:MULTISPECIES: PAS domain-containing protein [unclassified Bradyrhizobium]|uniref:PAS domain-containing protein n=1 Tax=unclassified Bradyrhizobium TaxID=2631580 RepID=UPI001FFA7646|nr:MULTISPECIES: PAS domain-containing protein [unclassified Bradyrhizobium]
MPQFEGHLVPSDMLRFVEEKLGAGIWRYDAAGQMQWSRGFYELLGLDPRKDAPSYAEMDRRIHPEDRRPKLDVSELMLDRSPLEGEFRIIRPNGTLRWVYNQAELLLDDSGKPSGILGVMFDITANRKKLQSLRTDAERYSALTQMALGLLWIGSSDGRITALPNAARMPQASLFFGRGWLDLLHGEERETALHQWSAAVEMRRPYTTEHRMRQPDGTYRWFRCSAVPVSNPDGNIREWVGVSIDVHDEAHRSANPRRTGHSELVSERIGRADRDFFRGHPAVRGLQ